jgi:gliding motility-associated-like protein
MTKTYTKKLLLPLILLISWAGMGQEFNTFDVRYQNNLRGDLTFIANNIVNRNGGTGSTQPEDPYNATGNSSTYNDWLNMQYIDVDGDPTTFSSSRATFNFPQANCNLIRYAGLYWSATYPSAQAGQALGTGRQNDFNQVQLMVPGGTYVTVTADEVLFDGFTSADPSITQNSPYACYADITGLITPLADPTGDYTVANVRSITGSLSPGGGAAAGWTLVVVYENPTLPGKLITTFDGFARVRSANPQVDINYTGFNTIPIGPVRANIGAAALEGDNRITGDRMRIRAASNPGFTTISNAVNPANNFFNSNITLNGAITTNRTPNSINTLGYDTDMFLLNNPANSVIPNAETSATFRFTSSGDQYYPFFNSFNIEIIEPNIVLEKKVEDLAGNDITGLGVNLGQFLDYILTFENIGNDDGTNYTLRDDLPINVSVIESDIVAPPGVTWVYDPVAHDITFSIPDNLIEEFDPASSIRLRVQVAENCFDFIDACTDQIANQAFSTYQGVINNAVITDDPSVSDFDNCGFVTPGATNFLLDDLESCDFSRTVQLCGNDILLDAGDNFDSYVWYSDVNENGLIDAGDIVIDDGDPDNDPSTQLVTQVGMYIVDKIIADPCKGFQEIITVEPFGATFLNPVTELINDPTNTVEGEVVICPNDGEELPKVFLCGANDTELLSLNVPDAVSIIWEQLDEASCSATVADCANKDSGCSWNNVATGFDYLAQDPGQYRLVVSYQNGCFARFYFNIFKNPLDPQYNSTDVICTTPGNITVTNMPADYEYQLLDATTGGVLVSWGASPSFPIATNGVYEVEIRQVGVTDGCIFRLDNIGILLRDYQVDVTARDADCNGLGEIGISQLNVEPQYNYEIQQGGTTVDTFGPSADNNYTFQNLNPGIYDVIATTDDGCLYTEQVTINDNADLAATATTTKPINCTDGIITVTGSGGFPNPDYLYAIWSYNGSTTYTDITDVPAAEFQVLNDFPFANGEEGDYVFVVVDSNNCWELTNTATITVEPSIDYTITVTDESCLGDEDGIIDVTVTNSNGYSVDFTLTDPGGGNDNNSSGYFDNLEQGPHVLTITATSGGSSCDLIENVTIGGPVSALDAQAVIIQEINCITNGIIEAQNVTGGTPPYEYSIDGGSNYQASPTFPGLSDGDYEITVRDASGCEFETNKVDLKKFKPLKNLHERYINDATCPSETGELRVHMHEGGTKPYTFEIVSPVFIPATYIDDEEGTWENLAAGTHVVRVTDANGCTIENNFTVEPIIKIKVTGQVISNVSCVGGSDGEVEFRIFDFDDKYSFSINGGALDDNEDDEFQTISGLSAGDYTILVTDEDTGCTATSTVTVSEPTSPLTLVASPTEPTCTDPGNAILVASDGWGTYTYTLTFPDLVTVVTNTTGNFTALNQLGTYSASVADANGCVVTTTFDFNAAIPPVLDIVPNDFCYDDAVGLTLTATVTSGGDGNFQYRLNGGAYDINNVFTGLGPGTYVVDVIDGKNCAGTNSITINPELSLTASAPNITSCATTADVTITASGGDGSYVYAIVADAVVPTPGDFGVVNPITVTGAGDYDVYVRDNNGGAGFCEAMYDITIVQDAPLVITPTATPTVCFGDSNGAINIVIAGGAAPYEYSIDDGTNYQTTADFVSLAAGTYPIRVRDANGCEETASIDVLEPAQLMAEAVQTQAYTCLQLGEITVGSITPTSGGSGDYQYSLNGGTWTPSATGGAVFTDLVDGTYSIQVRDANAVSCVIAIPDVIIAPLPTEPTLSTTVAYNCDGTGNVTILPNDVTYTYSLDAGAPQASNVFNNVSVGSHSITVDYGSGCTVSTTVVLDAGNAFAANITNFSNLLCNGDASGTITFEVENFDIVNGFEYSVNAGAFSAPQTSSPITVNGLSAGNNTIVVRDVLDNTCSITLMQNLDEPSLVVASASITEQFTCSNAGATITAGGSGGTPTYEYQLEDNVGGVITAYQVGTTFTAVPAGDYIVRVRDANGCEDPIDAVITVVAPDTVVFASTPVACYSGANDGTIQVDVTAGNGGYQFSLNAGPWITPTPSAATTYIFNNLASGNYTIDVKDQFGCIGVQQNVTINSVLAVTATAPNITSCATTADVTITAAGGDGSYVYAIVADAVVPTPGDFGVVNPITVTGAGDYDVYVRDHSGGAGFCEAMFDITIVQDAPIVITPTATPVICFGDSNGAINIVIAGGAAPYEYSIDNGTTYQTSGDFVNLAAGTYPIRVRDANNCEQTDSIVVTEPAQLVAEALQTRAYTCLLLGEISVGSVTPTSGGSGDYQYSLNGSTWTPSTTGGTVFTGLVDGSYTISVRDANATTCVITLADVIIAPLPVEPTLSTSVVYNCDGSGNITVLPNDPSYTYAIDAGALQASNVFNNIAVGNHTITVDYGSGCTVDTTVAVNPGNAFNASITNFTHLLCNGDASGTITFEIENFDTVNGFEYAVNGGGFSAPQTSSPITVNGLSAGLVTIVVRDVLDNSCSITLNETITEPALVVTSASITDPFTCSNAGATITASAIGGTPTYEFQLEDNVGGIITAYQAGTLFTGVPAGDYIVRARDINGCEDPIDSALTVVTPANPTFTATPTACYSGANDGAIQVDVTSIPGNGGFLFSINAGPWIVPTPSTATSYTFNNLAAGTYTIDVRDSFGCQAVQQNITINPQLTANAVLTTDLTCVAPATVTINTVGGSGTYSYEWSGDAGATYFSTNFAGNIFSTNTAGTYIFRVTDTTAPTACTLVTNQIIVSPADTPIITSVNPTHILCNGDSTGALDVIIDTSVGSPPYVIEVIETISATNYGTQTTGLPAGDYEVTITDDKGCVSVPFAITITQPDALNYGVDLIPIICNPVTGTDPGSITVENLVGGTAEYTYYLTGNNGFSASYATTAGGEDHTFPILEFGIYEVDVVDANGCSVRTTNIIASPPNDLDIDVSTATVSCALGGTAIVTVSSAVGSGNYEFAILETYTVPYSSSYQAPDLPGGDTATFTGLMPGVTYTFVVHDLTTNCYYFETAALPIDSPSNMAVTSLVETNVSCTGAADGNVTFTFDTFDVLATDVNYEIFNAQSNVTTGFTGTTAVNPPAGPITISNFAALSPGVYYILLAEVGGPYDGCSIGSPDFTIDESSNTLVVTAASPTNDNCNLNAGVITATAQFGTAPYEFQYLLSTDPAPSATSPGWTSNTTANVESGDYIVYVKDAYDCIQNDPITVALDATPEISIAVVDECADEGMFEVLVTLDVSSVLPYQLSINGGPFQNITFNGSSQYTVTGLSSGLGQTIAVRDLNGCSDTDPFNIVTPLEFTVLQTVLLDCEPGLAANAEITIEVSSGSGNYDYSIDGPGAIDQVRTALPSNPFTWTGASGAGTYAVVIYDNNTIPPNCSEMVLIDVPDAPVPVFTETHTDVTCNGSSDGTITLADIDNGLNPITYTLTPMPGGVVLNGKTFENVPAGTYDVRGTGTNSCFTDIFSIVITEPAAIVVPAPAVVEFGCTVGNNPGNATITIDDSAITGGSTTYVVYEFINDQGTPGTGDDVVVQTGPNTVYTETNVLGGSYIINVYDDIGCVGTNTAIVLPYDELLTATAAITNPISCTPGTDGEITITVTSTNNDTTRFEYSIDNGVSYQVSNVFSGLAIGVHDFLIRHIDTGCIIPASETILDPNTFDIVVNKIQDVICFGTNTGEVEFSITDATYIAGFDYQVFEQITNTPMTAVLNQANLGPTPIVNLPVGDYYVVITQDNHPFCALQEDFSIAGPPAAITANTDVMPITCVGNDGVIEIIDVLGGWGGYSYYLGTVAPTGPGDYVAGPQFSALAPGTYEAWVIDSAGCQQMIQNGIVLADPAPITATLQINQPNCINLEGELEVVGTTGGQGSNYSYQLIRNTVPFGAPQSTTVFSGLGAGSYEVQITDQWSCTFTTAAEILYEEIIPLATIVKTIDCTLSPDGEITITQTGGSGNFDYTVTFPDLVTVVANTTGVFTGLSQVGIYSFTIIDQAINHACSTTITQELVPAVLPILSIDAFTDVSCNGADDGTITASVIDNGVGPYTFEIISGPGSGAAFPIAPTSFTATSANFTGLEGILAPGITYTIRVTGTNGCTTDETQVILQPDVIANVNAAVLEFGCTSGNNSNNATITVDDAGITGGSSTYVIYEFVNDQGTPAPGDDVVVQTGSNTTYIETNVAGGSYTINVYDSNGCIGTTNAIILPYDELLSATATITNPISCNPGMDGEITVTVTSTNSDPTRFEYSIDNGGSYQASNIFGGLDVGTHDFLVRHIDTGCIISASEVIVDPNTFDIVVDKIQDVICFGTQTGQVTFELTDATYVGPFDWTIYDTNGTPVNTADDVLVVNGSSPTNGPTAVIPLFAGEYLVEITQTNFPDCANTELFNIAGPPAAITANAEVTPITCTGNDGIIEIIDVLGGWGGYSYYVGTVAPTGPGDYVAGTQFSTLAPGTYEAWVIDSSGCEQQVQNNIVLADPAPITATLQINQENCINLQGEIEVIGTTGGQGSNYTYQLIKDAAPFGAPQTSTVFSGLGMGSYEVVITDQWSCTTTIGPEVLYEEMQLTSTVVLPIDCLSAPEGEVTIAVAGGSGNFNFTVTFPDLITTASNATGMFNALDQAGTYTFVVTDLDTTNPVCTKTITQDLDDPAPVTFDPHTIVDVSCNGLGDGSITVNLVPTAPGVNDNPPYTYNLYDASSVLITGPQTSPIFTGLAAATYEVEAVSNRGCTLREFVVVNEPTVLSLTAAATTFDCAPDNSVNTSTVTATVPVGAGTSPYLYSIDNVNFQTSNTFEISDNGAVQNITVYVADANGCTITDTVVINPINVFTAAATQNTAISCVNPEEILITVSDDGSPTNTYTFELLPLGNPNGVLTSTPTNTTATFELSAVGNYTFRVTDNTTGCYVTTIPYEILDFDLVEVDATATVPVVCFGDTNGELEIDVTGYNGTFDYEIYTSAGASTGITGSGDTAVNPMTISGLPGGNFYVRITETAVPLCLEDSNVITIISPSSPLAVSTTERANVTCTNDQGEISVEPTGGYAPYDILLTNTTTAQAYTVNDVTSQVFTGLSAGNFTVDITDDNGCVINDSQVLVQPVPITADITATPTTLVCYGDTNATITAISVLGGRGSYQYQLNYYDPTGAIIDFSSGGQVSPIFNNIGAGIYSITVSDGWNCDVETIQVTISEPADVMSSLIQLAPLTCTASGQIELTATGGTGPYEWSTNATVYAPMSGGNTHIFTVADGVYQYFVRDSFGCEATISNQVSVDPIIPLSIAIDDSAAQINCTGEATATIIADAFGGLGNYSYELFTDAALTNLVGGPQPTGEFNNLIAGSYYVRVTSVDCVEVSNEIVITEPIPLQIDRQEYSDVSCAGQNDGTITVEVSGGTGNILYAITPNLNQFDTVNTFTDLEPGIYDVIAQDENGCFIPFQFTIIEPTPLDVTFVSMPEICAGNEDGSATVTITGGTAPYSTSFGDNTNYIQDQVDFTGLAAGSYIVYVRDAQGCEENIIVTIDPGVNLNATVEPIYECTGDTPNNYVNITLEDSSVLGDVLYAFDSTDAADLQLNPDFRDIAPGTHYITIAHANGCIETIDFEIDSFEPLVLSLEQNNINEITAVATGGTPEYTFLFGDINNGNDNTIYINRTDTYVVTVIDENGCEVMANIFMEFIDIEIPNFFTPDGDGQNDRWMPENTEGWPEILIKIYDRYGRVVEDRVISKNGWDGKYQGSDLPTGDYWYVIQLNGEADDREFVGHFTLYR